MALAITIELPQGERKLLSGDELLKELGRLTVAGREFGHKVFFVTKTESEPTARVQRVTRAARKSVHRQAVVPPPGEPKARRPFDKRKLAAAMRRPGFNERAYARRHDVTPSLVYYHAKRLQAKKHAAKTKK
jgi:transcriptional regulator with GAF, ATPase, and Fis domain